MRVRLRPAYTERELKLLYAKPHQHAQWADHVLRVDVTTAIASWLMPTGGCVADLSCGDAAIAMSLNASRRYLGDYAPGYEFHGPIEDTLGLLPEEVDLFICSETIEHLDDPDLVLKRIRDASEHLVLSTPVAEMDTGNPEHYWGWDIDGVHDMLRDAGWDAATMTTITLPGFTYDYQIWGCR